MKTRDELVTRALEKLRVVGAGQSATAEDSQLADKLVDPIMSDLATRQIYQWGDEDEIDEAAFEHLAGIIADAAAPDFGQQQDEQKRMLLESRLRQLDLYVLSGQPQIVEYY